MLPNRTWMTWMYKHSRRSGDRVRVISKNEGKTVVWYGMPLRGEYFICDPKGVCTKIEEKSYEDLGKIPKDRRDEFLKIWGKRIFPDLE